MFMFVCLHFQFPRLGIEAIVLMKTWGLLNVCQCLWVFVLHVLCVGHIIGLPHLDNSSKEVSFDSDSHSFPSEGTSLQYSIKWTDYKLGAYEESQRRRINYWEILPPVQYPLLSMSLPRFQGQMGCFLLTCPPQRLIYFQRVRALELEAKRGGCNLPPK